MRAITDDMDAGIVARIDQRLDALAREHDVSLPLAIESGSRAWGFASPDSDYDCRFFFVRRQAAYLTLFAPRDVIELPLDAIFDINGWDLRKALLLLLKGNAVVLEWLGAPIIYRGSVEFRDEMLALAEKIAPRAAIGRHYLHLGRRQDTLGHDPDGSVALKKLLYTIRPAAALHWMRLHPMHAFPPMHLPTLLAEGGLDVDCRDALDELLAAKSQTSELGRGPAPEPLRRFVETEFALAAAEFEGATAGATSEARAMADAFFRRWVVRLAA